MNNSDADSSQESGNSIPPQFLADVAAIAHSVSALYERTIASLEPQVLRVIEAKNKDAFEIESLLDQLLDVCDDKRALGLYRDLCRHYWTISQTNTAFYIDAYRSMWEEGDNSNRNNQAT